MELVKSSINRCSEASDRTVTQICIYGASGHTGRIHNIAFLAVNRL